ncbi:hypothetical protein GCM10009730_00080 [Streptomyces albidochromogenes]
MAAGATKSAPARGPRARRLRPLPPPARTPRGGDKGFPRIGFISPFPTVCRTGESRLLTIGCQVHVKGGVRRGTALTQGRSAGGGARADPAQEPRIRGPHATRDSRAARPRSARQS